MNSHSYWNNSSEKVLAGESRGVTKWHFGIHVIFFAQNLNFTQLPPNTPEPNQTSKAYSPRAQLSPVRDCEWQDYYTRSYFRLRNVCNSYSQFLSTLLLSSSIEIKFKSGLYFPAKKWLKIQIWQKFKKITKDGGYQTTPTSLEKTAKAFSRQTEM